MRQTTNRSDHSLGCRGRSGAADADSDDPRHGERAARHGHAEDRESFYVDGQPNLIEGDPHNGFLYLLAGGGALALGGFLIVVAFYLQDAWRRLLSARDRTERSLVVWAVTTWFVFLLHAVVEPVLTYPSMILTIWILMLLPVLVPLRRRPSRAQGLPASNTPR